jgi:ABC-type Fe3+-hydroxamate transport system substrate-binding protein
VRRRPSDPHAPAGRRRLALALLGWLLVGATAAAAAPARIVSLAPSITETLFAIGAGDEVVGVSDWCTPPPPHDRLPHAGSSLAPAYETIARLRPTLIVSEQVVHGAQRDLERLAPTRLLPWLAVPDVVASTRELGRLTGHATEADALAARLAALAAPPPPDAPRVLLVVGTPGWSVDDVVFIRRNSLHGAALGAAGARNAVDEDVAGVPHLGLERVLQLDPDAILVLVLAAPAPAATDAALAPWRRVGALRAVREGRLAAVFTDALTNGPSVLRLRDDLAAALARLPRRS